jgi:hypothetical protein
MDETILYRTFFCKVAYSSYDVASKMLWTDHIYFKDESGCSDL